MTTTIRRAQLQILLHGLIVLLIGLACGVPYGRALTQDWGEEAVRAWRSAHVGLAIAGIWLVTLSSASPVLILGARSLALLVGSLVASGYGLTLASIVVAAGGVRGLRPEGPLLNIVAFLANTIGAAGSVIGLVLMIKGAVAALRVSRRLPPLGSAP